MANIAMHSRADSNRSGRWTELCGQSAEAQHFCQGIVPVACVPGSIVSSYIWYLEQICRSGQEQVKTIELIPHSSVRR